MSTTSYLLAATRARRRLSIRHLAAWLVLRARNPDTGLCVTPADVHWVEAGVSLPDASTVGRNTLVAGGIINFDVSLSRSFLLGEQRRLEFRWEAFNALNHQQFTQIPERSLDSPHFLNRKFTDSGIRSMWAQLKFLF